MTTPRKNADQNEKLSTAPLPQRNAVSPPASEASKHEERLLDEALEESFPASDPIAELPPGLGEVKGGAELHEEDLLDEALEETFPASDPIAVYGPNKITRPDKSQARR
ncbi:MAG: hypothetical protein ACREX0_17380 [Noviherbaspirillum sp.]